MIALVRPITHQVSELRGKSDRREHSEQKKEPTKRYLSNSPGGALFSIRNAFIASWCTVGWNLISLPHESFPLSSWPVKPKLSHHHLPPLPPNLRLVPHPKDIFISHHTS